jgi:hypothetical protein
MVPTAHPRFSFVFAVSPCSPSLIFSLFATYSVAMTLLQALAAERRDRIPPKDYPDIYDPALTPAVWHRFLDTDQRYAPGP